MLKPVAKKFAPKKVTTKAKTVAPKKVATKLPFSFLAKNGARQR